jgi:GSCFA family
VSWAVTGSATHRAHRYERSTDGAIAEWSPESERATYEQHFREAGAFVFTLGLAEVWSDRENGRVFWRGVPEEIYDTARHEFRITTVAENEENIRELVRLLHAVNPAAPIVLTLSPVPLLATFRDISCMTADCVSKSVLRVALDNVMVERPENVYYWPSFELVRWAGSALDWRAWGDDARHADRYLVQCIVNEFVESFYGHEVAERLRRSRHQIAPPHPLRRTVRSAVRLSHRVRSKVAREAGALARRRTAGGEQSELGSRDSHVVESG